MDWQELTGNWVLVPNRPTAVVHFLGGAFVATAPQVTYRRLLERLAASGYAVIATPFVNTFDHAAIAQTVLRNFDRAIYRLHDTAFRGRYLPIYGLGHSMGCKLHLLIGSLYEVERAGNMLISFNNYSARDAVPIVEQMSPMFAVEFTPSPLETTQLIAERYQVRRNLLIKFANDTIDQTAPLHDVLSQRFAQMVIAQTLPGNHLTPLGPDMKWQVGDVFTPFDAIGQWFRQGMFRELEQLERTILRWLNPLATL